MPLGVHRFDVANLDLICIAAVDAHKMIVDECSGDMDKETRHNEYSLGERSAEDDACIEIAFNGYEESFLVLKRSSLSGLCKA